MLIIVAVMAMNNVYASNVSCAEGDNRCTFVLLNGSNNQLTVINQPRAEKQLSPFSTFKIVNSIVGLETKQIKNLSQTLNYDHNKYPTQPWWPPVWKLPTYNLTSAFKYSVVPIYRQLATNIGQQTMEKYLQKFSYGNQNITSGVDDFWLNGSLKISAIEQVKFLQKLHNNQLALLDKTLAAINTIMLVDETESYKIYAKTGAGRVDDQSMLGWYVGMVERDGTVYYFALNFNRPTYAEMKQQRITMAMNNLRGLNVID